MDDFRKSMQNTYWQGDSRIKPGGGGEITFFSLLHPPPPCQGFIKWRCLPHCYSDIHLGWWTNEPVKKKISDLKISKYFFSSPITSQKMQNFPARFMQYASFCQRQFRKIFCLQFCNIFSYPLSYCKALHFNKICLSNKA